MEDRRVDRPTYHRRREEEEEEEEEGGRGNVNTTLFIWYYYYYYSPGTHPPHQSQWNPIRAPQVVAVPQTGCSCHSLSSLLYQSSHGVG